MIGTNNPRELAADSCDVWKFLEVVPLPAMDAGRARTRTTQTTRPAIAHRRRAPKDAHLPRQLHQGAGGNVKTQTASNCHSNDVFQTILLQALPQRRGPNIDVPGHRVSGL